MDEVNGARENGELSEEICFSDGQLSCLGQDWHRIPLHLANSYGALVRRLDLSFNKLGSLETLDRFPSLEELILDNNDLSDSVEIPRMPKLHTLMLNKNKLKDIDSLVDRLEKSCPSLTYLSLLGNEACPNQLSSLDKDDEDYQRYRYYVLYRLSRLKFLDSTAVDVNERLEAQRRGPFLKVARPKTPPDKTSKGSSVEGTSPYTPLPQSTREQSDHKARFTRARYKYYGANSEGNRFIRNHEL